MKSPERTQPAGLTYTNGSNNPSAPAPTQDVAQVTKAAVATIADGPKLNPPQVEGSILAVGAAVWSSDKRVNGLYTTFNARNSWMSIAGVGWKKLATNSDSANDAMSLLASHCREKNCRIDYAEDSGEVKEIYVW